MEIAAEIRNIRGEKHSSRSRTARTDARPSAVTALARLVTSGQVGNQVLGILLGLAAVVLAVLLAVLFVRSRRGGSPLRPHVGTHTAVWTRPLTV